MSEAVEQFLQMVKDSDNIVFFGGAGVSTESGIPDFRSVWTDCITKSMTIRRRRYSVIAFIWRKQKNFTGFTGIRCFALT